MKQQLQATSFGKFELLHTFMPQLLSIGGSEVPRNLLPKKYDIQMNKNEKIYGQYWTKHQDIIQRGWQSLGFLPECSYAIKVIPDPRAVSHIIELAADDVEEEDD